MDPTACSSVGCTVTVITDIFLQKTMTGGCSQLTSIRVFIFKARGTQHKGFCCSRRLIQFSHQVQPTQRQRHLQRLRSNNSEGYRRYKKSRRCFLQNQTHLNAVAKDLISDTLSFAFEKFVLVFVSLINTFRDNHYLLSLVRLIR